MAMDMPATIEVGLEMVFSMWSILILRFNVFKKFSALLNMKQRFLERCLSVSMDGWMGGWTGKTAEYRCVCAYLCDPH